MYVWFYSYTYKVILFDLTFDWSLIGWVNLNHLYSTIWKFRLSIQFGQIADQSVRRVQKFRRNRNFVERELFSLIRSISGQKDVRAEIIILCTGWTSSCWNVTHETYSKTDRHTCKTLPCCFWEIKLFIIILETNNYKRHSKNNIALLLSKILFVSPKTMETTPFLLLFHN